MGLDAWNKSYDGDNDKDNDNAENLYFCFLFKSYA